MPCEMGVITKWLFSEPYKFSQSQTIAMVVWHHVLSNDHVEQLVIKTVQR